METNRKIIGNAMSAYFMIFICVSFFLNKENDAINNNFVKSHTKTALLIHFLFLFVYIIFVSLWLWDQFALFGFAIGSIIASGLFLMLFWFLLYGIYQAHHGKVFTTGDMIHISKTWNIIDIQKNVKISEQDTVHIILSYIPFIWYSSYFQLSKNTQIKNIVFINLMSSSIITLFFVLGAQNVALFFGLIYILFVAFSIVTLVGKHELIVPQLSFIPSPEQKYIWTRTAIEYFRKYFSKNKKFEAIQDIYNKNIKLYNSEEENRNQKMKKRADINIPRFLIYVPVINILTIFSLKTRYKYHIINGLVITLLCIIWSMVIWYSHFVFLVALFPASFGIWYLPRLWYQMPYIYDLYHMTSQILYTLTHLFSRGRSIQKTVKTETLSIKNVASDPDSRKTQ